MTKDTSMGMQEHTCQDIQQSLELVLSPSAAAVPTRSMSLHVTGCDACQTVLEQLYVRLTGEVPPVRDCEPCQADLAAYIDLLLNDGAATAAQELPHVWWHIWQCAECAETFELTLALINAETRGQIMPLASVFRAEEKPAPILKTFLVRPAVVARLFSAHQMLGIAYGSGDEIVVAEEPGDDYNFQISVQRAQGGDWTVTVTIEPQVSAAVLLTVGASIYRALFDERGRAVVYGISAADLQDPNTGISVAIELLD